MAQGSDNSQNDWWFCLKHHEVEPRKGCKNSDRLGPYQTREEAAGALARVEERNEEWEEADREDR